MKDFYLFPGAHKTATTLLQAALHAQAERLEAYGLHVIPRGEFYASPLFYYLKSLRPRASHADRELRKKARQWARGLRLRQSNSAFVLSGESVFGELPSKLRDVSGVSANALPYPGITSALETMTELFPHRRIRITYYLRRQDSFFESNYVQRIQKGTLITFDHFYELMERANFDWSYMLECMAQTVGRKNIVVKPFETIYWGADYYIRDFFSRFVSDEPLLQQVAIVPPSEKTNVSLSQDALDIALREFPELDPWQRKTLIRNLQREAANNKYPRARLLSEERRAQVAAKYSAANEDLFAKWQLDERFRPYYTFSDTRPPVSPPNNPSARVSQTRCNRRGALAGGRS